MRSRFGHSAGGGKGWQPWGLVVPVIGLGFVAATVVSVTALLQHMGLVDPDENPVGLVGFMAFLIFPFAALGTVVIAWVSLVERRDLASVYFRGARPWRPFFGGLLTGIAMVTLIVIGIYLTGGCQIVEFVGPFHSLVALGSIAILLAGFIIQSSIEELLFRGWMLAAIATKLGLGWGVMLSSLAFTIMHFDPRGNWVFKSNVFLFAVFGCCWVIRSGNIWGVMGWHSGWNWLLAVGFEWRVTALNAHLPALMTKVIPTGNDYLNGGIEGPEGSIACTFVLSGGIIYHLLREWLSREGNGPLTEKVDV